MKKFENLIKIISISTLFASSWIVIAIVITIALPELIARLLIVLSGVGLYHVAKDLIKCIRERENEHSGCD